MDEYLRVIGKFSYELNTLPLRVTTKALWLFNRFSEHAPRYYSALVISIPKVHGSLYMAERGCRIPLGAIKRKVVPYLRSYTSPLVTKDVLF
jgi:hypothetical protein